MDCPRCGAENTETAHWCGQCFAPLAIDGTEVRVGERPTSRLRKFTCGLNPSLLRWSLSYHDEFGAGAGHAEVSEDRGFASAKTVWGDFTLQPYESGDEGSFDVYGTENDRLATYVCDEAGPSFRYLVRDESAAPVMVIENKGGLVQRVMREFDIAQVNSLKLGKIRRHRHTLATSDETKVVCARHEMSIAFRSEPLVDVRAVAAAPLVLAIRAGDPHREQQDDSNSPGSVFDLFDSDF